MTPVSQRTYVTALGLLSTALVAVVASASLSAYQEKKAEEPRVVNPGTATTAPADAVVLFDGTDYSAWSKQNGDPVKWKIQDGAMHVQSGGGIFSKEHFGDSQVHVEFSAPGEVKGKGQGRGNSGVYVQGRYEIQVLDSYDNSTYPNGQCGAIYGHHAPLVNACRGPGEWQSFDIVFRAARFDESGKKIKNATMTVLHNGVLIQDHADVPGSTTASPVKEGPDAGPLYLQDHGNPVRYRNVWIRPL